MAKSETEDEGFSPDPATLRHVGHIVRAKAKDQETSEADMALLQLGMELEATANRIEGLEARKPPREVPKRP